MAENECVLPCGCLITRSITTDHILDVQFCVKHLQTTKVQKEYKKLAQMVGEKRRGRPCTQTR
jgi:hypothetical protein